MEHEPKQVNTNYTPAPPRKSGSPGATVPDAAVPDAPSPNDPGTAQMPQATVSQAAKIPQAQVSKEAQMAKVSRARVVLVFPQASLEYYATPEKAQARPELALSFSV